MKIKSGITKKLSSLSLKTQLAILIVTTFSVIIVAIIFFNYQRNIKTIATQQTSTITHLLRLESQNIDTYLSEIDRYSLLMRHEQSFMQIVSTTHPLSYEDTLVIQTALRSLFDSRNDLASYRLYLNNKEINYEIDSKQHKIQSFVYNDIQSIPYYDIFTTGKYYKYFIPTTTDDTFMVYYRTIINIQTKKPLAIIELTFDTSFIDALIKDIDHENELFCMVDTQNKLLYSSNRQLFNQDTMDYHASVLTQMDKAPSNVTLNNEDYLFVSCTSSQYGYTLYKFNRLSELDQQLSETRNISLLLGFASIIITTILAILLIQVVTKPLSTLSHRLRGVGSGNFKTTINVGGSSEIADLADDFNAMIARIDDLINKTYKSELNEKTARLIALEAQINPHFLYNTLQAISAEAIVNNQPKINYMVTALASMMRYSIKGGDFALLSQEVKHVKDYLLLQQSRFEDKLTFDLRIEPVTLDYFIPKISIQTLVENSIIHGVKGNNDSVHIEISSTIVEDTLIIKVVDNGDGIRLEKQKELRDAFTKSDAAPSQSNSIGLVNLYSRLQLLYRAKAKLELTSNDETTTVTLIIPTQKEVTHV